MSWLKKLTEGLKKTSSSAKSKLSGIFVGKKIDIHLSSQSMA